MTKNELRDLIRGTVKKKLTTSSSKVDLDKSNNIVSFDSGKFPILEKFPTLKEILIDLLTNQYELFVKEILWTAPRPTTLKIILNNSQDFYLIHTERSWEAKIEGKKYYLNNLPEEERAAESLSRILSYAWKDEPDKEPSTGGEEASTPNSSSSSSSFPSGGGESFPPAEELADEAPIGETPPTDEPTEEAPPEIPAEV